MVKVRVTASEDVAREPSPTEDDFSERLKPIFAGFHGAPEELIPLLQRVQAELGYLPQEAMIAIAEFLRMSESAVYAVATFYAQFRFTPIGRRHVLVCRGTSCHVRGAPRILQEIEKQLGIKEGGITPDREYSLETVACIGACGLSPCVMTNQQVEARLTPAKVAEIFSRKADHA
jgi:NADH-quinone oxidoreductase subunit E